MILINLQSIWYINNNPCSAFILDDYLVLWKLFKQNQNNSDSAERGMAYRPTRFNRNRSYAPSFSPQVRLLQTIGESRSRLQIPGTLDLATRPVQNRPIFVGKSLESIKHKPETAAELNCQGCQHGTIESFILRSVIVYFGSRNLGRARWERQVVGKFITTLATYRRSLWREVRWKRLSSCR